MGTRPGASVPDWKRESLSGAYVISPLLALILGSPALTLLGTPAWWLGVPHVVGLLAAPGFVYAWTDRWRSRRHDARVWAWLDASLVFGFAAGAAGMLLSVASGLLFASPFAALAAWHCLVLRRRITHFRSVDARAA